MQPINLSPSFLMKVYSEGYDYAVGEKIGLFPKEDTAAMDEGRLMHSILSEKLGGEKAQYVISPFDNFRTKAAQEWCDSQTAPIVTQNEITILENIAERAINHPSIKNYLKNCKTENTIEKRVGGYNIKGIIDVISDNAVIDWKFVAKKNFSEFEKKALYMNYDMQAAVYDFLGARPNVIFVGIEKTAPYRVKVFECDQSFLDSGANKFDKVVKVLDEAKWRKPDFDIEEIGTLMSWENYNG